MKATVVYRLIILVIYLCDFSSTAQTSIRKNLKILTRASFNCTDSDCYPPSSDLLLGRKKFLYASSTCGDNNSPDKYCVFDNIYQGSQKASDILNFLNADRNLPSRCFLCDSHSRIYNHRIENVVMDRPVEVDSRGREIVTKWWQSENGKQHVYIRFDLEALFTITVMIIRFKTYPPAAMSLEKSDDYGRSWKPIGYYAYNCAKSFPNVPRRNTGDFKRPFCTSKYSGLEYSTGGELYFAPLTQIKDQTIERTELQDLLRITNLRINFSKLHTFGDYLINYEESNRDYYYAVNEIKLYGSCLCHGHSSKCETIPGISFDLENVAKMSHGKCKCEHFTSGENCERCLDLFNDRPWSAASNDAANECKKCECNNHAKSCYFDSDLYRKTNFTTGGVCRCLDNTEGINCEKCLPGYHRNPQLPFNHPQSCRKCKCDLIGTIMSPNKTDVCSETECVCKINVEGKSCDRCKPGFWNLDLRNKIYGCKECSCLYIGTVDNYGCNTTTGLCAACKKFVTGKKCDKCLPGYYGLSVINKHGCKPCNCHKSFSYSSNCDETTGQCSCKPHTTGIRCENIESNFFCPSLDHLVYEAESAGVLNSYVKPYEKSESSASPGSLGWTGSGFMRVYPTGGLKFNIDFEMKSGIYDILIRYESLMHTWSNVEVLVRNRGLDCERYENSTMLHGNRNHKMCSFYRPEQSFIERNLVTLEKSNRSEIIFPDYCFDEFMRYEIEIKFNVDKNNSKHYVSEFTSALSTPTISIDSLVLLPRLQYSREDGVIVKECEKKYYSIPRETDSHCDKIICKSLIEKDGPLQCQCDPLGSVDEPCNPYGGQCKCKTNIFGRKCDKCQPNTWGFTDKGCQSCKCDPTGAKNNFCNSDNGDCDCYENKSGKTCDKCIPGYYNFPKCIKCECNGQSNECDSNGDCLNCQRNTFGTKCEKCKTGYFGDPIYGSPCLKCSCPGTNGNNFATSCSLNRSTGKETCDCLVGYTGDSCEKCQEHYYGSPLKLGGSCQFCQCNGNVDSNNRNTCDSKTGQCLGCLFNTEGFNCERCKPGFYGNALEHKCKPCDCNRHGTVNNTETECDAETGNCFCLPNVMGRRCDKCALNHWDLNSWFGCKPCDCDTINTHLNLNECDLISGQCFCQIGRAGRRCDECPRGSWGMPRSGCKKCECNEFGVQGLICHKFTGQCLCKPGITGSYCDHCSVGTIGRPPNCIMCDECFQNWNKEITGLSIKLVDIEKQTLNLFTFKDTNMAIFKFTSELDDLEDKMNDIKKVFNNSYNLEEVTELFNKVDSLKLRGSMNINSGLEKLNEFKSWNVSSSVFDKIKLEYSPIKKRTSFLLRKSFDLREIDLKGAISSILNSQETSVVASSTIEESFILIKNETNFISDEFTKKLDEIKIKNSLNSANFDDLIYRVNSNLRTVNQSIFELNNQFCESYSDDIYLNGSKQKCQNGLEFSYQIFIQKNNAFNSIYDEKEFRFKKLLVQPNKIRNSLKHQSEVIYELNKTISEVLDDLHKNQTVVLGLSNLMQKLGDKHKKNSQAIFKTCTEVPKIKLDLSEDKLNQIVSGIRSLSRNLNAHVDIGDLVIAKKQLHKVLSLKSNINHVKLSDEREIKKIIQENFHYAQFQRYEVSKQLVNLNDLNSEATEQNIQINESISRTSLKLDESENILDKLKEDISKNRPQIIIEETHSDVKKLKKKLDDLNAEVGKVLNFINVSKDLAKKRKLNFLVELQKRVMDRVRNNEEKSIKVQELIERNAQTRQRIGPLENVIKALKSQVYHLRSDLNQKMKYFKNCQ